MANILPRADGRPEAYDIQPGAQVACIICHNAGKRALYSKGQAALLSPLNSPYQDGQAHIVCKGHLPDDVVICDPGDRFKCRDLHGNEWREQ